MCLSCRRFAQHDTRFIRCAPSGAKRYIETLWRNITSTTLEATALWLTVQWDLNEPCRAIWNLFQSMLNQEKMKPIGQALRPWIIQIGFFWISISSLVARTNDPWPPRYHETVSISDSRANNFCRGQMCSRVSHGNDVFPQITVIEVSPSPDGWLLAIVVVNIHGANWLLHGQCLRDLSPLVYSFQSILIRISGSTQRIQKQRHLVFCYEYLWLYFKIFMI